MLYSGPFDALALFSYIDELAVNFGMPSIDLDTYACMGVLNSINHNFPHNDGLDEASPFKKVAYFVTNFVATSPIYQGFPREAIGRLSEINNHQNAIVAYNYAVKCLHGAKIIRVDGGDVVLSNKITVSRHSYCDIIDSFTRLTPSAHFQLVSILFEHLAYRANPEASYEIVI